jgi:hypothetical protein
LTASVISAAIAGRLPGPGDAVGNVALVNRHRHRAVACIVKQSVVDPQQSLLAVAVVARTSSNSGRTALGRLRSDAARRASSGSYLGRPIRCSGKGRGSGRWPSKTNRRSPCSDQRGVGRWRAARRGSG